ncbi:hypothetical protein MAUB1S_02946 [Mycolicibacterium aubagnense]
MAAERIREKVQAIASALLTKTAIPAVKAQDVLLDEISSDPWWVDVTLPMLELARLRLRTLVQFLDTVEKVTVYTDFEDELTGSTLVDLPGITPGTNWERFRAKATAYLKRHEDHISLQRLRRNKPLTPEDLTALELMLVDSGIAEDADINQAKERSHGLGLFVRSRVGVTTKPPLTLSAPTSTAPSSTADQIQFISLHRHRTHRQRHSRNRHDSTNRPTSTTRRPDPSRCSLKPTSTTSCRFSTP